MFYIQKYRITQFACGFSFVFQPLRKLDKKIYRLGEKTFTTIQ